MGQARLMKLSVYRLSHFERAWQSQGGKKIKGESIRPQGGFPTGFPEQAIGTAWIGAMVSGTGK